MLVVAEKGPKLFEAIHLTQLVVFQGLVLKVFVNFRSELAFQPVAVEAEQAL